MLTFEKLENSKVQVMVEGWIEQGMSKQMNLELEKVIDEGFIYFLIDMSKVVYIDSTGIGVFVRLRNKLIKRNGKINIINLPKQVERLFKVTRLYDLLCNQNLNEDGGI